MSTGSGFDLEERLYAPYLGRYLDATVNVVDIAGGAEVQGEDAGASAVPNGLTIYLGVLSNDETFVVTHSAGFNFNPEREDWIAGINGSYQMIATLAGTPYTSVGAMIQKATAADPVVGLATAPNSWSTYTEQAFLQAFGIHYRLVEGYNSSTTELEGFLRGDGQVSQASVLDYYPMIKANEAYGVTMFGTVPKSSPYYSFAQSIPSLSSLLKRYPPKTTVEKDAAEELQALLPANRPVIFAQSATPGYITAALRAGWKYTFTNPSLIHALAAAGDASGYVSPVKAKSEYVSGLTSTLELFKKLGIS